MSDPTDDQICAFLNDWEDGTPKSFGTVFTSHWDGESSCMMTEYQTNQWDERKRSQLRKERAA